MRAQEEERDRQEGGTEAFIRSFIGLARRRRPLRNRLHMEDEDAGAQALARLPKAANVNHGKSEMNVAFNAYVVRCVIYCCACKPGTLFYSIS